MIPLKYKKVCSFNNILLKKYIKINNFTYIYYLIGLLWSQCDNCYVGYLDFEDEKKELQSFMMKCEKELQEEIQVENLHISNHERGIATQVHQIIWHSATCKFAYLIAYYGIKTLTAHKINKILFQLAANLECLGIHTIGSICDGAGENRNHIKSFDW